MVCSVQKGSPSHCTRGPATASSLYELSRPSLTAFGSSRRRRAVGVHVRLLAQHGQRHRGPRAAVSPQLPARLAPGPLGHWPRRRAVCRAQWRPRSPRLASRLIHPNPRLGPAQNLLRALWPPQRRGVRQNRRAQTTRRWGTASSWTTTATPCTIPASKKPDSSPHRNLVGTNIGLEGVVNEPARLPRGAAHSSACGPLATSPTSSWGATFVADLDQYSGPARLAIPTGVPGPNRRPSQTNHNPRPFDNRFRRAFPTPSTATTTTTASSTPTPAAASPRTSPRPCWGSTACR